MDVKKRINNLREKINKWSVEYYVNDSPSVSDLQFDGAMQELKILEQKHPEYTSKNSPTQRVGGYVLSKFQKVKHNFPMLSLDNAFSFEDILNFKKQIIKKLGIENNIDLLLEPKIDGLSISIKYENGIIKKAITRGDGQYGEDVTHNVKTIKTLPLYIKYKRPIEIRGEIFVRKSIFNKLNMNLNFANPRNFAAGTLRQLDSKVVAERGLEIYLYSIPDALNHNIYTMKEMLDFLASLNFPINKDVSIVERNEDIKKYISNILSIKENLDYSIDGIVFKVNDIRLHEDIGFTTKFPKFMIAYKFPEEIATTRLLKIFSTIGRTGRVTYNAKLETVRLAGSFISAATLHNANYIISLDINVNDYVQIKKAGDIIPKVLGVFKKINPNKWKEDTYCPVCINPLVRLENEIDQYCINKNCAAIIESKFIHFTSRKAMNIEGMGSEIIKKLLHFNFINNFSSIYKLNNKKEELINLDGFNVKSVNNMLISIEESKNNSLDKVIFALGIRHIGEKISKDLAKRFNSIKDFFYLNGNDLLDIRDFGKSGITSLVSYFNDEENLNIILELLNLGVTFKNTNKVQSHKLQGHTFVITGTLSKSRDYFVNIIESHFGNVTTAITSKTSFLLLGQNAGSKLEKAKKMNIQILSEQEFYKILE